MTTQTLLTAISTIGFPSVMCYLMFKYLEKYTQDTNTRMSNLTDVINNNTTVITKFMERSENMKNSDLNG